MFISILELFKIGIGPSSSHTLGPMVAAKKFIDGSVDQFSEQDALTVRCTLKGSLAYTGKGHSTDRAITLGFHGFAPELLIKENVEMLCQALWEQSQISVNGNKIGFTPAENIIFDKGEPLPDHPNGMVFELLDAAGSALLTQTYFSIGGGFICTDAEIKNLQAPLKIPDAKSCPYPFDSAASMLEMAGQSGYSIAKMKWQNELERRPRQELEKGIDTIWAAMQGCLETGLDAQGVLPGGLDLPRRAADLYEKAKANPQASLNDYLCAYAMAVNEENAAGHMVVTAPTNGAAGVIPAVAYYFKNHENASEQQIRDFLLTASAIGGLIKHRSSISGAEVGCQGEVGSAAAMAAAGLCEAKGGTPSQVENAAEIALEHHLGMTCDPVKGLVQVPCIERNGFGAIKAYTAASLALMGSGRHFMPLDACIAAMKQTGLEMSQKYKETSLGGLAVSLTEC